MGDGIAATTAALNNPDDVAVDASGDIFIADTANNRIREVNAATGLITTVAGTGVAGYSGDGGQATNATFSYPTGIAVDSSGNLYIADTGNSRIREITAANGVINTIAGTSTAGYTGDNGPAKGAQLNQPTGVAVANGNVYISDTGNNVVRFVTGGTITTIAGVGTAGYTGDTKLATVAQLNAPEGVALDASGNLFIADTGNNVIREVAAKSGLISTVAGNGTAGYKGDTKAATLAELNAPAAVTVDVSGDLLIADTANSAVREVTPDGNIATLTGNGTPSYAGDGGPVAAGRVSSPNGVAVDSAGNVYIADTGNSRIRFVSGGKISTVAGNGTAGYYSGPNGDGGDATAAQLYLPTGGVIDSAGDVYIADTANNLIRMVSPAGVITTVAGTGVAGYSGDGGLATAAEINQPVGLAVDAAGNLYFAEAGDDRVRKITVATGKITTVAGNGNNFYSGDGGQATAASFGTPGGVAVDSKGDIFISDTANSVVREVNTKGVISTYAGSGGEASFEASFPGYSGDNGIATNATLNEPEGLAIDGNGSLYIADTNNSVIRVVNASGIISTFAGTGQRPGFSGDGSSATAAKLRAPTAVAVDQLGNVYIADSGNNRIRWVDTSGAIRTVAGNGTVGYSGDNGLASLAEFNSPQGVFTDANGNIYIADTNNSAVRAVLPNTAPVFTADTPPNAVVGVPYSYRFKTTGVPVATYTIAGLPSWAQFNLTSGVLSGTPTALGNFTVTVTALNGILPNAQATATFAANFATPMPQTISFTLASPVGYGVAPITLSATGGGSENPVTFSVVSGPGTVNGSTLTVTGVGDIVVQADQAGNVNYTAAPSVQQTLVVEPGSQKITFAPPAQMPIIPGQIDLSTYATGGGSTSPVTFTVISGPGTINGTTLTASAIGPIVVEADQAADANFTAAPPVQQTITVVPTPQVISFSLPSPVTYGVAPITLTATGGGSGNPVTFSVVSGPGTITGSTLTVTGIGTIVVEADQASSADYAAATPVQQTLQVNPIPQSISFSLPTSVLFNTTPIPLTATGGGSGSPVTFSVVSGPGTVNGDSLTVTGAGNVVVEADQAGGNGYGAAAPVQETIFVISQTQSISFSLNAGPVTFGVPPILLSATGGTSGNPVTFSVVSGPGLISGAFLVPTSAGTIVVEADQAAAPGFTAAAPVQQSLQVNLQPQTISFSVASPITFAPGAILLTASGGGSANPITFSIVSGPGSLSGSILTVLGAGAIVIEADEAGDGGHSAATPVRQTLQVNQAAQAITFNLTSEATYGTAPIPLAATGGLSGKPVVFSVVSGPGSITGSTLTVTGAGAIVVEADQAGNVNYTAATSVQETVQIDPATLTVTANNAAGSTLSPLPSLTDTVSGLVNGDTSSVLSGVSLSTTATSTSPPGTYPIQVSGGTAANYTITPQNGTLTLTSPSTNLLGTQFTAVGADAGGGPVVQLLNQSGTALLTLMAFDPSFTGGVRVATGDFNGDGYPDIVAGTGPGVPSQVRIFDGKTGQLLETLFPFESTFTGGVFVAVGDLTGKGYPDLVVTPDEGGGPRVRVYDGKSFNTVADFFGIDDPNFRGGARAAVGDLGGNGYGDLIVAAGFGGGPRIAGFDGLSVAAGAPVKVFADFFAFDPSLVNGAYVAVGDVNGDGAADVIVGGGPGGAPRVTVFDGRSLLDNIQSTDADFFAGDPNSRSGARVAAKNLDGDDEADIVVGSGTGATVTAYLGKQINLNPGNPAVDFSTDVFPGFTGGVFVG
ncbi:hypothetical protein FRUB_00620 [Fimbriiglobus ruber]|uniref:Uncharacterized protein n=2 Tax=Fimbriiglobus ruber TaxID=1908690 RepID=A0A225DZZ9_9BACT|nr:hypothetical protein FRUB_00620 [Fimbriiglobus ruber]